MDDVDPPSRAEAGLLEEREEQEKVRSVVEWVAVIVGALVVALLVKTFLFQAFYIPSGSMEPTLHEGDRVLVNKMSYRLHDLNRGDVVVFERPPGATGDPNMQDFIKRVVGLPGDELESRDGVVFVNGMRIDEPYLNDPGTTANLAPTRVPDGHVFVMGDNRSASSDSRSFGPIPVDSVVGRAFVRVWPLSNLSGL